VEYRDCHTFIWFHWWFWFKFVSNESRHCLKKFYSLLLNYWEARNWFRPFEKHALCPNLNFLPAAAIICPRSCCVIHVDLALFSFRLALYVYEYLLHVGAQKAAQTFLSEVSIVALLIACLSMETPNPDRGVNISSKVCNWLTQSLFALCDFR